MAQSYPGSDTPGWYAVIGSARMPAEVVGRMNAAITKVHALAEFQNFAKIYGYEGMTGSAADLGTTQAKELAQWDEIDTALKAGKR